MKSVVLMFMLLMTSQVFAQPFKNADAAAGKALLEKNCISCHAASFGGDGSAIYTREHRKVKTAKGLMAQVRNCNTMLDTKLFEDEELDVAAHLNKTYYKFTE